MAVIANGNKPINRFFTNIPFCIPFVVNLRGASATVNTPPIISFKYNISFSVAMPLILDTHFCNNHVFPCAGVQRKNALDQIPRL
jgi:hypothetical protein